ncbi:hypothetical protein HPB48_020384 [Haemaphysalis longicornis]|uniref:CCHC-type domain-containing protein n=1 Tax=Haemaphysalis longicornis TaxID=44386 RepID=A0A9J6FZ69_HAELO|nr:hypothetical protein HPB48_020384 [Haemaphysalis longicornis]
MAEQPAVARAGPAAASVVAASAPSTSQQIVDGALRIVTTVEGEVITTEEYEDSTGWLQCHRRTRGRVLHHLEQNTTGPANSTPARNNTTAQATTQRVHPTKSRRPRCPKLPRDDIEVVIRPRDGFNVARVSDATLRDSILLAAGLEPETATEDLLRANPEQNILVVSTPLLARAERYARIEKLKIGEALYSTRAYVTTPDDSVKGVIHNIPEYDSAEDIVKSVVYSRNPTALHARRMGRTNSTIIAFSGDRVPYFVYSRGAEYRCYIHKRKHTVCSSCGRLGHRMDVCPWPDRAFCSSCGLANPMDEHVCTVKCALCGKDHVTGDKQCKKRYRPALIVKQHHWRREREHSRDAGDARLQRDRSASFPRLSRAETPSNTVPRRDDNRAQAQ